MNPSSPKFPLESKGGPEGLDWICAISEEPPEVSREVQSADQNKDGHTHLLSFQMVFFVKALGQGSLHRARRGKKLSLNKI